MTSVAVAVVGGGPAGAVTAALLARPGREVLLLDRARFPREKLCGDFIHPFGVAVLARLGVLPSIRASARHVSGMLVASPSGREVVVPFPAGEGLSLSRAVVDHALVSAAEQAGAHVMTSTAVRSVERGSGEWRLHTDGETIRASILVGADGFHSRVAQDAGLAPSVASGRQKGRARRRLEEGRYAIGLRARGVPVRDGLAEMHLGPEGYCGVSRFPDGESTVTAVFSKSEFASLMRSPGPDRRPRIAAALAHRFEGLRSRLAAAEIRAVRTIGPLVPASRAVVGDGVLLVGDAAAHTDPLTGQGVSLALAGAVEAAASIERALRAGNASASCLRPYRQWHEARMASLRRLLRLVDWLALRSGLIDSLLLAWQRNPSLASRFMRVVANAAPPAALLNPTYLTRTALTCAWRT